MLVNGVIDAWAILSAVALRLSLADAAVIYASKKIIDEIVRNNNDI